MTFEEAIEAGHVTSEQAAAIYESLPPVPISSMLGTWRGSEFPSGHPNDGMLVASGWFGKRFTDVETVDPLLFFTKSGDGFFAADPVKIMGRAAAPAEASGVSPSATDQAAVETDKPTARLRMVEYRGVSTATMIYDALPIYDHFRRIDDDTVLGAMDARGDNKTYYFLLRRAAD